MGDDDEVDALERRLRRQSRRTRFAGGVAGSLMGLLALGFAVHELTRGRVGAVVGLLAFAAFAMAGAVRLFQGQSTEGLQMHSLEDKLGFRDDDDLTGL